MNAVIDIAASHKKRVPSSLCAQALGVSEHGTPYQLWEVMTGRAERPDISGELRVQLGHILEPALRPLVEERIGGKLLRDHKEYIHPHLPLVGHLDFRVSRVARMVLESLGKKADKAPILDMKTSLGFRAHRRFGTAPDEIESDVFCQLQAYLMLTGAPLAFVAALIPGPELRIYTIPADPEVHAMMEEGIARFWWHVQNDVPPPVTTLADASRRWPIQTGATRLANPEDREAIDALRRMKAQIASIQAEADLLELAIKTAIGDAKALVDESDRPLATWHSQTRKTLDTQRLRQEQPEIAAQYSTETIGRVFRLCKDQS